MIALAFLTLSDICSSIAIYCNKPGLYDAGIGNHSHEEVDTLIPMYVLVVVNNDVDVELRDIDVYSPDTDLLILLMYLASSHDII